MNTKKKPMLSTENEIKFIYASIDTWQRLTRKKKQYPPNQFTSFDILISGLKKKGKFNLRFPNTCLLNTFYWKNNLNVKLPTLICLVYRLSISYLSVNLPLNVSPNQNIEKSITLFIMYTRLSPLTIINNPALQSSQLLGA